MKRIALLFLISILFVSYSCEKSQPDDNPRIHKESSELRLDEGNTKVVILNNWDSKCFYSIEDKSIAKDKSFSLYQGVGYLTIEGLKTGSTSLRIHKSNKFIDSYSIVVSLHTPSGGGSDNSSVSSSQCIAITQKGTRCKRTAEKGSSYCWQHK